MPVGVGTRQPYVTGPCLIFVGLGGTNNAPLFLGTCERGVKLPFKPVYSPVYNDVTGPTEPYDESYDGVSAMISGVLTTHIENTYALVQAYSQNAIRGTEDPGDQGALMQTEDIAYPVWIKFPYQTKQEYNDMPAGYRFLSCKVVQDDADTTGTIARRIPVVWQARRVVTLSPAGLPRGQLYDFNMANLPAVA